MDIELNDVYIHWHSRGIIAMSQNTSSDDTWFENENLYDSDGVIDSFNFLE